jgi:hypothetical protein
MTGRIDPMELGDPSEDREGVISLRTSGVVQLGLLGDISLTFLDPNNDSSELALIDTSVQVQARDNVLSPDRLHEFYIDLVDLFVNRWKATDIEVERTETLEIRSANVGGINAEFRIDYDTSTIVVRYWDPWFSE